MELFEGVDIGDDVETLKRCPDCNTLLPPFHNHVSVPNKRTNIKDVFFTWSCYSCEKEYISYQDNNPR